MDVGEKGKRFAIFSPAEEETLISLIEKYKNIVECKKSGAFTWKQKEAAWKKIENEFNARSHTFRSAKNLKDKYLNLKKKTKLKFSTNKQLMRKTGGGPAESVPITDAEITLKQLLDEQITGLKPVYDCDLTVATNDVSAVLKQNEIEVVETFIIGDSTDGANAESTKEPECILEVNQPSTSVIESEEVVTGNWETYCASDLKRQPSKKLRTSLQKRVKIDKKYITLNQQLIEEKISFIKIQKEKFLEEHALRMELLRKQIANEDLKRSQHFT